MSKQIHYTMRGNTLTISGWAREVGINHVTIRQRIGWGWSPELAIFTPVDTARHPPGRRGNDAWHALSDEPRGMSTYRRSA